MLGELIFRADLRHSYRCEAQRKMSRPPIAVAHGHNDRDGFQSRLLKSRSRSMRCFAILFLLAAVLWRGIYTDVLVPDSNIELKNNTIIVVLGASGDLAKKKTVGFKR